ncbi:unnamed protein product, partial [marine sediment metagenome]
AAAVDNLACKAVNATYNIKHMNTDLKHAIAIFQTLQCLGIQYVKDPSGSPGTRMLDRVKYPAETLEKLNGDCDDTSVLYAALLSAVGIDAAIISYQDHVLTMFNTGIYEKNRYSLSIDTTLSIVHNGTLWIPVETTLISKGFLNAWKTAAEEFHQAVSEGQRVAIIDLEKAWSQYGAVSYEGGKKNWNIANLNAAVLSEIKKVTSGLNNAINSETKKLVNKSSLSVEERNRLGVLYARAGKYAESVTVFEKLVKKAKSSDILNNLGCA